MAAVAYFASPESESIKSADDRRRKAGAKARAAQNPEACVVQATVATPANVLLSLSSSPVPRSICLNEIPSLRRVEPHRVEALLPPVVYVAKGLGSASWSVRRKGSHGSRVVVVNLVACRSIRFARRVEPLAQCFEVLQPVHAK